MLITARGGSKRLPKKNKRLLNRKPLIVWSIDIVKDIPDVCDILVSTDDAEIAEIALSAGALVPWMRPIELSSDTSTSVDVSLHALKWYESKKDKIDGLLLLQPTSPFRTRESILKGIELFYKNNFQTVLGVSLVKEHPLWCYQFKNNVLTPYIESNDKHLRSQDLPQVYVANGAFYLITAKELYKKKSFYSDDMIPLIINNPRESLDIDTEWDWEIAKMICNSSN